jgi:hypothetical protein
MYSRTAALALALTLLSASTSAQSIPSVANSSALALVDAEYVNSGFAAATNTGFGVSLKSTGLLSIVYDGSVIQDGQAYTVDQVTNAPEVFVTPSADSAASFTSTSAYTLMLADAARYVFHFNPFLY